MDAVKPARPRGRPRRFDPEHERALLLEASVKVLRRKGFHAATLEEVLTEAGVSSRAFYRHFGGKDELLLALLRNETDAFTTSLQDRVTAAPGPIEAVEAWIDGYLDALYVPKRARRSEIFMSDAARGAAGYHAEMERTRERLAEPLVGALAEGHAAGLLRSPDPVRDARIVLAIVEETYQSLRRGKRGSREDALATIGRFCWPGLGLGQVAQ